MRADPTQGWCPQSQQDPCPRSPHRDSWLPQGPRAHGKASRTKAQAVECDTQASASADDRPPRGSQKGLMRPLHGLADSAWSRVLTATWL